MRYALAEEQYGRTRRTNDDDSRRRDISEAILAKLRFAVAPFESVDTAIAAMPALRPEVVVARALPLGIYGYHFSCEA